jgi:hypothetical protein
MLAIIVLASIVLASLARSIRCGANDRFWRKANIAVDRKLVPA